MIKATGRPRLCRIIILHLLQSGPVGLPLQIVARSAITMGVDSIQITLTCLKTSDQGAVGTKNLHLAPNGIYQDLYGVYIEKQRTNIK